VSNSAVGQRFQRDKCRSRNHVMTYANRSVGTPSCRVERHEGVPTERFCLSMSSFVTLEALTYG